MRFNKPKIISILWFLWSLPHIFPGAFAIKNALENDISSIDFLFPDVRSEALMREYPREVEAILVTFGQHGFNLMWFGLVALVLSVYIWLHESQTALIFAAVIVGFADLGALFATIMIGRIDLFGILIFSGTAIGLILTLSALSEPPKGTT